MVVNIIVTILSALGIFGFFCNVPILLLIGAVAVIIEMIIGLNTGELRNIFTYVVAIIIGSICVHDVFVGGAIGLCFESVIMSLLGWITLIIAMTTKKI